jgi:hypothetical protein
VRQADPGDRRCPVSPCSSLVENARRRSVLLSHIVFHLARYRMALAALAEFERRHGNAENAEDLEDAYSCLDSSIRQFSSDCDDAHAAWARLRDLSEMATYGSAEV